MPEYWLQISLSKAFVTLSDMILFVSDMVWNPVHVYVVTGLTRAFLYFVIVMDNLCGIAIFVTCSYSIIAHRKWFDFACVTYFEALVETLFSPSNDSYFIT